MYLYNIKKACYNQFYDFYINISRIYIEGDFLTPEMLYVYTIWQQGSFSNAAEKLYLSQPALSMAIRKLEKELGMPLFDRKHHPLRLTDAGEIYLDTARKIQQLEWEQEQKLQDIQNMVTGTIRLGGTHYLNAYILPELLVGFNRLYPGVTLQIMENSSFALGEMLERRELDMTFNCKPELIQEYPNYPMFEDHILLAVPKDNPIHQQYGKAALTAQQVLEGRHLEEDCPKAPLDWFADEEFILLSEGNNLHERAWQMFEEAGIHPHVKLVLNQLVTAFHLAEAAMGVTFVSDRIISPHNNRLLYYPLQSAISTRLFHILLPQNSYVPTAVRKLIAHIRSQMISFSCN